MSKSVQIVTAMSELGAGTRGASLGWEAIRTASYRLTPQFFYGRPVHHIAHENELLGRPVTEQVPHHLDGIARQYARMAEALAPILKEGTLPLVFTGDHSNAGGTMAGIHQAFPNKRLGVVWIDAHADLHSPYTSPTGNVHGMPLATALGIDNLENKERDPSAEELRYWQALKGDQARLRTSDLFFIGLRDTESPEDRLRQRHGIPNVTVGELRQMGPEEVARQALSHLGDCDILYISFDVDSLDPIISQGTGTPVPGGLNVGEAKRLLQALAADPRLVCLEVTEVNPCLDTKGNAMAETAFKLVMALINQWEEAP